jgi:hypothetical protein
MNHQEFIERTGLTPTIAEYQTIEAIYMAAGEMNKDEFCKEFRKCRNSRLVSELFKTVCTLKGQYEERCNEIEDLYQRKTKWLIFLSTGRRHSAIRNFLKKLPKWLDKKKSSGAEL